MTDPESVAAEPPTSDETGGVTPEDERAIEEQAAKDQAEPTPDPNGGSRPVLGGSIAAETTPGGVVSSLIGPAGTAREEDAQPDVAPVVITVTRADIPEESGLAIQIED